ncbi:hypothetical protein C1645_836098 [Glomus cerebriforme]|uniref:ATPase domain-containing protein n=1 Tax=Glomus cerebriforme TaxID=658196 RepID=A0A397SD90_9GLOM|nr:hypothetical protein C1645_836098 [Glomus cerebriforme]
MSLSKITLAFRKSVSPSHFVAHRAPPLRLLKLMLRNSRSDLLRASFSRPYTKTNNMSYSTKANEETNKELIEKKANLEKNGSIKEKEEIIVEETGNEIKKIPLLSSRTFNNSSPYFTKFARDTAESLPTALAYYLVGVIAFFLSGNSMYCWYRNRYNERLLNETIEKGTRPNLEISRNELVPRPLIIERLKKILRPSKDQASYYVVCGEHGTGKITLTKIASREVREVKDENNNENNNENKNENNNENKNENNNENKNENNNVTQEGGMGVIYVDVPAAFEEFAEEFAKAINFTFEEHISYTAQLMRKILGDTKKKITHPGWLRAMNAFKRGAAVYKKKHGKPPVIVYDNVSRLIHKNPEILDILQDDAKDNADDRKYIAVFVSSEGSVLRRMQSRSAWSRADDPMEIGDLSKEESLNYLIEKRGINKADAEKLYELVGGRIVDLHSVANKIRKGRSFDDIKKKILNKVENKFGAAQLLPNDTHYEVGKSIISDLLKYNELSFLEFKKYFHKINELNEVLGSNVFAYHPENNTVTFQSQSVECYIRENSSIFTK